MYTTKTINHIMSIYLNAIAPVYATVRERILASWNTCHILLLLHSISNVSDTDFHQEIV